MKNAKVITTENENAHRSRLIKSFQAIENLEDYKTSPKGVWGSVATINIIYEHGDSQTKVTDYVTLRSTELDFEFNIPFDDDLEANEGEIIVYNLSRPTIARIERILQNRRANSQKSNSKKERVSISAGYEGDTGCIFEGYMTKITTKREGADKVTTIKVTNDIEAKENLELTTSGNASTILKDLVKMLASKTNISRGLIKPARDHTYTDSVSLDGTLEEEIKRFSQVCGVSTIISKNVIYCCKLQEVNNTAVFDVSADTGMIGDPQPFTEEVEVNDTDYKDTIEGVEIDMLLQHRMSTGAVINLQSIDYKGKYYVKSGYHTFNESECTTHIKAVKGV